MTLHDILIEISHQYASFRNGKKTYNHVGTLIFDLTNKSIYTGNYFIIKNGKLVKDRITLTNGIKYSIDADNLIEKVNEPYKQIEKLYGVYCNSIPGQSYMKRYDNFKAMDVNKMSLKQIEEGESRIVAKYALESFVLLSSLCEYIIWENKEHFFWFSRKCKGLVLYRDWICQKE